MTKAYLVMEKFKFSHFLNIIFKAEYPREYQLYVPDKFILGNFKDGKNGLELTKVFYSDYGYQLIEYKHFVKSGKLKIIKELDIPYSTLERLLEPGKTYNLSKNKQLDMIDVISEEIKVLNEYL